MVIKIGKILHNFHSLELGCLQEFTICYWETILPPFSRDALTPLGKLLLTRIRYQGDEKGILDLKAIRNVLTLARKNICISRQNSDNKQNSLKIPSQLQSWRSHIYIKRYFLSTNYSKWEYEFHIIKFPTPRSAVLDNTLTGKLKNFNVGNIKLRYSINWKHSH